MLSTRLRTIENAGNFSGIFVSVKMLVMTAGLAFDFTK
jgi:hypothetical protein